MKTVYVMRDGKLVERDPDEGRVSTMNPSAINERSTGERVLHRAIERQIPVLWRKRQKGRCG